jgi:toxin CcdB
MEALPIWYVSITSAKMAQFDTYSNPVAAARGAYPFVVVLQSDFTLNAPDQIIVAPLAPLNSMSNVAGRLTPIVAFQGDNYVVLVHALAGVRTRDLKERNGSMPSARNALLASIDYLFFGI